MLQRALPTWAKKISTLTELENNTNLRQAVASARFSVRVLLLLTTLFAVTVSLSLNVARLRREDD